VFEHRNYFALAGVVLAFSSVGRMWLNRFTQKRVLTYFGAGLVLFVLTFQTHVRAVEWSDEWRMHSVGLEEHPRSVRLRNVITRLLAGKGELDALLTHLNESISVLPDRSHFRVQKVIFSSILGKGDEQLLNTTKQALVSEPLRTFDGGALIQLYGFFESGHVVWPGLEGITEIFKSAVDNDRKQIKPAAESVVVGHYASLLAASEHMEEAIIAMETSLSLDPASVEARIRLSGMYLDNDQVKKAVIILDGLSEQAKTENLVRIRDMGIDLKKITTAGREN